MRVQIFCLSSHPLLARVFAADALAGLRVFDEPLAVPDDAPGVQLILKDAVQALAATVNG